MMGNKFNWDIWSIRCENEREWGIYGKKNTWINYYNFVTGWWLLSLLCHTLSFPSRPLHLLPLFLFSFHAYANFFSSFLNSTIIFTFNASFTVYIYIFLMFNGKLLDEDLQYYNTICIYYEYNRDLKIKLKRMIAVKKKEKKVSERVSEWVRRRKKYIALEAIRKKRKNQSMGKIADSETSFKGIWNKKREYFLLQHNHFQSFSHKKKSRLRFTKKKRRRSKSFFSAFICELSYFNKRFPLFFSYFSSSSLLR